MLPPKPDPVRSPDDEARKTAAELLALGHAALSYRDARTGAPGISRIGFGRHPGGGFLTLVSELAPHTAGLRAHPACAVMLGDPGAKGDPLTHPRLMVTARAEFVSADAQDRQAIRDHWLLHHPKAKLYVDFADFSFVRLLPDSAVLNGGFARAFRFAPEDL